MPVHNWTRVSAGTFHDFHGAWIIHMKESLNGGQVIADILTLHVDEPAPLAAPGGVATLAAAPPRVSHESMSSPSKAARALRRTLTIRHASTHRIVALVEVLSPATKDRVSSVEESSAEPSPRSIWAAIC
jgi:hypothetical protein